MSADEQIQHLQAAVRLAPTWGRAHSALADALRRGGNIHAAQTAQGRALALGDHTSLQERIYKAEDENSRKHMLRYHPNEPKNYHFHDPKMMLTQEERDAAMQELRLRASSGNALSTQ